MKQIRKDYLLERYCIISEKRGKRPHDFKRKIEISKGIDYFAPENENLTPKETYRVGNKIWQIRTFPNKFAAVENKGKKEFETHDNYYKFAAAYGFHEVIVETRSKIKMLSDLSEEHVVKVLETYSQRIDALEKKKGIKYVTVFKNKGSEAGTSIIHSHSQLIAYNQIPPLVKEKIEKSTKGHCKYCEIIEKEQNSERKILETENIASFTPYCSIEPYHAMIFPKRHVKRLSELNKQEKLDIAKAIIKILGKLKEINASYNLILHYSPRKENLHLQIEIIPRLAIWAGFELGTGTYIISVSPETAAEYYRK